MRAVAGAVTILAGAVVLAAAVHGAEMSHAAGRIPGNGASGGTFGGVAIILVGLLVLALGVRDRPPHA